MKQKIEEKEPRIRLNRITGIAIAAVIIVLVAVFLFFVLWPSVFKPAKPVPTTLGEYYDSLDMSCTIDRDCEVKNIGNCCGYFPECVNTNAVTDPALAETLCDDRVSACGFAEITKCRCVAGKCTGI